MVRWSEEARANLIELVRYLNRRDPAAARRQAVRIRASVAVLAEHPWSGRVVPEFEVASLREVVVAPYRLIYQVADEVTVLTIVHGRQDLDLYAPDGEE